MEGGVAVCVERGRERQLVLVITDHAREDAPCAAAGLVPSAMASGVPAPRLLTPGLAPLTVRCRLVICCAWTFAWAMRMLISACCSSRRCRASCAAREVVDGRRESVERPVGGRASSESASGLRERGNGASE